VCDELDAPLSEYLEAEDRTRYEYADAEQTIYSRALRYLTLHRDLPKDTLEPSVQVPGLVSLTEFLEQPDEPLRYRVDGLLPAGGRVVFAAQYKAGKTTARDNLIRALVDGEPFLDHFAIEPVQGLVLIDNEMSERQMRQWLRDQGIANTDAVRLQGLRGRVGTFNLLDDGTRATWAQRLREVGAQVVVLDCLRPVLDALGLSEDKDAGRFLVAFDQLLLEAGISEGVIVHHFGHAGERSRGDTRLRDWPDAEWQLVRESEDAASPRFFKAYGRDVDVPEALLAYDEATRRLSFVGGNRKATAGAKLLPALLDYLRTNPGSSGRQIEAAFDSETREDVRAAIKHGIKTSAIDTSAGPKRAVLHFASTSAPSAPQVRQRTESECASAPIEGALHSHTPQPVRDSAHSNDKADDPWTTSQPARRTA
jgi:hypothetical protein